MFLHVSVCPFCSGGGGMPQHACRWYPSTALQDSSGGASQHALQVSRPTPRAGKLRGLACWGSAHTYASYWNAFLTAVYWMHLHFLNGSLETSAISKFV